MPSKGCPDGAPEVPFGDEVADPIRCNIGACREVSARIASK
jgi:hypothetical protein